MLTEAPGRQGGAGIDAEVSVSSSAPMHAEIGGGTDSAIAVAGEQGDEKSAAGFVVSAALHALALAALIVTLGLAASPTEDLVVIPADIVQLADAPAGPPEPDKAIIPQQEVAAPAAPSEKSNELTPTATRPPPDELEIKLRRLAELRQPLVDQDLAPKGEGLSHISAMKPDAAPGMDAAIKDFLRDQIEHHWGLDLAALHGRNFSVLIRVAITRAGVVTGAEVVDRRQSGIDAAYDEAALSARNAALLSSPLTLPPGHYPETMSVILTLNTKDALR